MARRKSKQIKKNQMRNIPLFFLGIVSLILGIIGVALPVLPTTPFILLSAFCFSKSSDRFYRWLISIPTFGKSIQDWNEKGSVNRKAKILCLISIISVITYFCFYSDMIFYAKIILPSTLIPVLLYVLTRPEA